MEILKLPVRNSTMMSPKITEEKRGRFIIVFHGTGKPFQAHEIEEKRDYKNYSGKGIWTTIDYAIARMYGSNVHHYILDTSKASQSGGTYFSKKRALIPLNKCQLPNFVSMEQLRRQM